MGLSMFLLQVVAVASVCMISVDALKVSNCYEYGTLPIETRRVRLSPRTIRIPSVMRFQFEAVVRTDVGTPTIPLAMRVYMSKVMSIGVGWLRYSYDFPVPCAHVGNDVYVGSCDYEDVCGLVDMIFAANSGNQTEAQSEACYVFQSYNMPCSCPIPAGTYSSEIDGVQTPAVVDLTQGVDQIPSALSLLLEGDYKMTIQIMTPEGLTNPRDSADDFNTLLGCFDAEYEITMD